ncbi:hypothetical protein KIPE111705_22715 [Kibdelosporangium persicum]|uniref:hypothetical protein n=1 Tax=Kibdelosporangium persicum TaxID=2698649 RepID=UPI001566B46F|nr:hypothetical protein [Kibdelosporangium persicum]
MTAVIVFAMIVVGCVVYIVRSALAAHRDYDTEDNSPAYPAPVTRVRSRHQHGADQFSRAW